MELVRRIYIGGKLYMPGDLPPDPEVDDIISEQLRHEANKDLDQEPEPAHG